MSWRREARNRVVGLLVLLGTVLAGCGGGSSNVSPSRAAPRSTRPSQTASVQPSPTTEATPADGFLVANLDVAEPEGFAVGFGSVWVPSHHSETISRIDPATNQVAAVIQGVGYQAQDVVAGAGSVWVPASGADYLVRIDPATNTVASRLKVGAVSDVDFGFGSLWAATKDNKLLRIDPKSEDVVATLQIGPKGLNDCNNSPMVTASWVWVSVCDTGMLIQVDPGTNRIAGQIDIATELGTTPGSNAVASRDGLWVAFDSQRWVVARLDPDTGKVLVQVPIDDDRVKGSFMWMNGGTLWLGGAGGILTAFDAQSLKVLATYQVTPTGEVHPGAGFGSVWVTSYNLSSVLRFDFPTA